MGQGGRRPRLILLTQWFDPEPAMKGLSFAQALQQRGFDVEVVTGFPNYPGGEVYNGYRIRLLQREELGGVRITRVPLFPSHDRSKFGRILNYVSFFLSTAIYLVFVARRADAIYAYHPPITVGLAAAIARALRRTPVVLDVQDMWPDTLKATGMIGNDRILRVIELFCRWTWRHVDRIAVLSEGFRRLMIERGVPAEKVRVIYNWAGETAPVEAGALRPAAFNEAGRFRVLFAGNIGAAQGLDAVLDAAAIVARENHSVEFCFLGSGIDADRLQQRARSMSLPNVRFLPRVPASEVGTWLNAADCLLVHLRADPLFEITIPSKTQAYMAAGRPLLMAVAGDAADLVRRSGGGVVVPPQDAEALATVVLDLAGMPTEALAELGRKGKDFYEQELSMPHGVAQFEALLQEVMTVRNNAQ